MMLLLFLWDVLLMHIFLKTLYSRLNINAEHHLWISHPPLLMSSIYIQARFYLQVTTVKLNTDASVHASVHEIDLILKHIAFVIFIGCSAKCISILEITVGHHLVEGVYFCSFQLIQNLHSSTVHR